MIRTGGQLRLGLALLSACLTLLSAPYFASAVWTPLQNTEVSPYVTAYQGIFSDNVIAGTQFTATSTFSVQELNLRLCKSTGSTGNLVLIIATGTLSSYSTVATSDPESFSGMNDCSPGAPTTTMAFHNFSFGGNIYQFTSGTPVVIVASTTNPSPSAYGYFMTIDNSTDFSYWGNATGTWRECINYLANGAGCRGDGYPRAWYFTVSTAGSAPTYISSSWTELVSEYGSTTVSQALGTGIVPYIECDAWYDIGCHLVNAAKFLFYPVAVYYFWEELDDLDTKFPFSYFADIDTAFDSLAGTGTTTLDQLNIQYGVMGVATGTLLFVDLSDIDSGYASDFFTSVRSIISILIYLWLIYAIWRFVKLWVMLFAKTD